MDRKPTGAPAEDGLTNYRSNSQPKGFVPKAVAGSDLYHDTVALPVMAAIDEMPDDIRACVNDFGYIGVYLAWKRKGMTAAAIRQAVAAGTFEFND